MAGAGHSWARPIMEAAWKRTHPSYTPSLAELQITQALCAFDGAYGKWKESAAADAHNWGAIQHSVPKDGVCPAGSFLRDDVNVHGTNEARQPICFKSYPDDVSGAADVVYHMTTKRPKVWEAMKLGDMQRTCAALYASYYFGGFHSTKPSSKNYSPNADRLNVTDYANNLWSKAVAIAKDMGEPLETFRGDLMQPVPSFGGKPNPLPPYSGGSGAVPPVVIPAGPGGGESEGTGIGIVAFLAAVAAFARKIRR